MRYLFIRDFTRHLTRFTVILISTLAFGASASARVTTGEPAPDFSLPGSDGKQYTLSDLRGNKVILEWTNDGCPYVRKHYSSANMQGLQKQTTEAGVIWLSIISSKPGSQGHVDAAGARQLTESRDAHPTSVLLDPAGDVGRQYGAKTTPHMYVIDEQGKLVYQGAIDDKPSARQSSLQGARNYVLAALDDMAAGRPVQQAETTPYGCSVKY